jgi:hypothetical protein
LDRFTCVKTYHEFDDEIPHLEGGIPILGQSLESPYEAPSFPHEEVPATSSESEVQLDDVIERIEKLRLDENLTPSQSTKQLGPTQKGPPKWLTKTLESVHLDEIRKRGTGLSSKQDGGNGDNSNSGDVDDMDVSYDCELNLSTNLEPTSFKEVASHDEWKEAMQKEYDALIKNGTLKLVDPPFGTKPIGCKWVFKNTYRSDGSLDKHKARLVEKGFAQKEGVDYEETFAPTTKWATICTLFSMAAQNGWKIHQMDVKTAFLNGDLKENVFMSQIEGFVVKGQKHKVCKFIKSLYGLTHTPQAWYEKLTKHLLKLNFKHFNLDVATLFVKKVGKAVVYLIVYVDDLFIIGNNENYIASIQKEERLQDDIFGTSSLLFGIEVIQNPKYIFISQKKYIGELLNKFGMAECNPVSSPLEQNLKLTSKEGNEFEDATKYRQFVGCLLEITQTTSPNKFHNRGKICGNCRSDKGDCVAQENT